MKTNFSNVIHCFGCRPPVLLRGIGPHTISYTARNEIDSLKLEQET